jgi:ADP-ribose pyrophosphatase YjhB (NUDIX family)
MITFKRARMQFDHRVAGIALNGSDDATWVLLHRAETDDFWALPGGRVELLESSTEALCREMHEELEVEVQVKRLVWVVENFFQYQGRDHHELGLYYLISLPQPCPLRAQAEFFGDEQGLRLIFKWFPLSHLPQLPLYPTFLREGLQALPASITHIVHTDPPSD